MIARWLCTVLACVILAPTSAGVRIAGRFRGGRPGRVDTFDGWVARIRRGLICGDALGVVILAGVALADGFDITRLQILTPWVLLPCAYAGAHLGFWCDFWPFVARPASRDPRS